MFGEFAKCAVKVTRSICLSPEPVCLGEFCGQQPERSLDEPCGLSRRHTLLVGPSKLAQQMAETILKQSGDLFAETALDERQIIKIQKLRLDLSWLNAPPEFGSINRIQG